MATFRFITNRVVKSPEGKEGRIKMLVRVGSDMAEGEYKCPACGDNGKINQPFKKPIMVKCTACSFLMRLARLKDEMKKKKKQ
ncbi:MAG: hypothetical protein KKA90_03965 [Nanoarchaeota archaeon]|nr:hypothetical protein [Nanoarchaeota archaeon]